MSFNQFTVAEIKDDLKAALHQLELNEENTEICTVSTSKGLFEDTI